MDFDLDLRRVAHGTSTLERDLAELETISGTLEGVSLDQDNGSESNLSRAKQLLEHKDLEGAEADLSSARIAVSQTVSEAVGSLAQRISEFEKENSFVNLSLRVPRSDHDSTHARFNAGVATALGLIPNDKAGLTFAAYNSFTGKAAEIVAHDLSGGIEALDPDSSTCWHLAANSFMGAWEEYDSMNQLQFLKEVAAFKELQEDPIKRLELAKTQYNRILEKATSVWRDAVPDLELSLPDSLVAGLVALDCQGSSSAQVLPKDLRGIYTPGGISVGSLAQLKLDDIDWVSDRLESEFVVFVNLDPYKALTPSAVEFTKATGMQTLISRFSDELALVTTNSSEGGVELEMEERNKQGQFVTVSLEEASQSGRLVDYFPREARELGINGLKRFLETELQGDQFTLIRSDGAGTRLESLIAHAQRKAEETEGKAVFTFYGMGYGGIAVVGPNTSSSVVELQLEAQTDQKRLAEIARAQKTIDALDAVDFTDRHEVLKWLIEYEGMRDDDPEKVAKVLDTFSENGYDSKDLQAFRDNDTIYEFMNNRIFEQMESDLLLDFTISLALLGVEDSEFSGFAEWVSKHYYSRSS